MITTILHVALGGALGAVARYLTGLAALRVMGAGFPWGTMTVNVAGSFAMGVLFVYLAPSEHKAGPFLMTGFLGGFTTFSAFSLDAMTLLERGQGVSAAAYVVGTVVLSLAGLMLGVLAARALA